MQIEGGVNEIEYNLKEIWKESQGKQTKNNIENSKGQKNAYHVNMLNSRWFWFNFISTHI